MTPRLGRVAALLFCSGACALVYQVAWFRELRLIFGASTASSAAVLAVFMGGLGVGGARLGRRADASKNPLMLYAHLEIAVACTAALTPLLVRLANTAYIAAGGVTALGMGATAVRLALSVIVLGPVTLLMGGTLPAAARAVELGSDRDRRRVGVLYGVNTFGAVVGCVLANFFLLELLGTRLCLWVAALINLLVGVIARSISRTMAEADTRAPRETTEVEDSTASTPSRVPSWFPPAAAALAGGGFMLMELTWYRTLAPILGGSSYTFGLILAVALVGIAIGGAIYARTKVPATLAAFGVTCGLEALFVALPYALGDRLALLTALLRPICRVGFGPSIGVWSVIAAFVVLPAAIVSGAQFPLIIGLYGSGKRDVGRDVGAAYLANTLGAIVGSLAGGFGLLPILGAAGCYRLVVGLLATAAAVAFGLSFRTERRRVSRLLASMVMTTAPLLLALAQGPGALWRHAGIGAGRVELKLEPASPSAVAGLKSFCARDIRWEADGVESTVAVAQTNGFAFVVNGKTDGHATLDAPTQVMGGLLAGLLHGNVHDALVIGLGTGSTAGWLGAIGTVERVDVVELEPAIARVARDCGPVNGHALDNPKVHVEFADAREVLRTTRRRYDVIFSEPSNPYRAGISSLYTKEYYDAALEHLADDGLFVQWLQAYEVDAWAVATASVTLRQVFGDVEIWQPMGGDLFLVARRKAASVDMGKLRTLLAREPFASGTLAAWRTTSAEGVVAHYLGNGGLANTFLSHDMGAINTDDQNLLEFAFARGVGMGRGVDADLAHLAERLGHDRPDVVGGVDWSLVAEERALFFPGERQELSRTMNPNALRSVIDAYRDGNFAKALHTWKGMKRVPRSVGEAVIVSEAASKAGERTDEALVGLLGDPVEQAINKSLWSARHGDGPAAVAALAFVFENARKNPWIRQAQLRAALTLAEEIATRNPKFARRLYDLLSVPFAVEVVRDARLIVAAKAAFATQDAALCVKALEPLEPPPWDRTVRQMRVSCYSKTQDPLLPTAERELLAMLVLDTPIGASIPSPPRAAPADAGADASTNVETTSPDAGLDASDDAAVDAGGHEAGAP